MKTTSLQRFSFSAFPLFSVLALLLLAPSLHAASAQWNGTTDAVWATTGNWSATPVPGTGDTATFNNAGNGNVVIDLGAGVTITNVLFDTASAAAYTIGTSSAQNLTLDPSGSIIMNSTVIQNQTFSAGVVLGTGVDGQVFNLTNNSTTHSLNFTDIRKAQNNNTTINVSGAGTINADRIQKVPGGAAVVSLNKSGSGTLNLNGTLDNRFVDLIMSDGLVVLNKTGATNARAASTATVNGGTLQISGSQGDQINSTLTVNGGIVDMNGRNEAVSNLSGTNGTVYNTANASTSTLTLTASLAATYAGNIADNAGGGQTGLLALVKQGTGVLTLSGSNSFTGGTTVSAGAVTYANTSAKSGLTTVAAAGSVGLGVGGAGFFSSANVDSLLANSLAGFSLDPASGVRVNTAAGDFTYAGNRTDSRVLTKAGGNILFLTGNNSAATGTTVVGSGSGVLSIEDTDALAGWNVNGRWSIANGSALVVGNAVTDGNVTTILATTNFANSSNFGFDTSAGNRTYSANLGPIGGNGGLFKIGANTLTLSGSNSFIGINEIRAGALQLGSATALGVGSTTAVAANTTLDLNGQTIANNLGSGANNPARSAFQNATSVLANTSGTAAAITGNVVLSTGTGFSVDGTGAITLGTVTRASGATGDVFLIKAGTGSLTLGGTVDNSNLNLTVNNGTVVLNKTVNAGSRAASDVLVNGGTLRLAGDQADQIFGALTVNGGVVDLNGKSESVSSMTGTGGTIYNTANATTSTITLAGAGVHTYAGVIADNAGGGQTGLVEIVKNSPGTLVLAGINTYSGNTTVNSGIFALATNGSLRFVIGGSGTNNALGGTATTGIDGQFAFDLSSASTNTNATWTIVANTLANTYGTNFLVTGFSGSGGLWTNTTNGVNYVFSQSNSVLSVQASSATPYSSWVSYWQGVNPGFTNTAGTDNPDGDPFDNNEEFAFDGNPTIGTGALLTAVKSGTNTVFNYVALTNTNAVTYQVQSTTNLTNAWTNASVTISNSLNQTNPVISQTNIYVRKEFVVPATSNNFYRVQATILP